MAFSMIQPFGIIAVISQVSWQVFIIFIPVIATSVRYQQYYISSARQLARLVGVCTAPVIQHFAEAISGAKKSALEQPSSIRAGAKIQIVLSSKFKHDQSTSRSSDRYEHTLMFRK